MTICVISECGILFCSLDQLELIIERYFIEKMTIAFQMWIGLQDKRVNYFVYSHHFSAMMSIFKMIKKQWILTAIFQFGNGHLRFHMWVSTCCIVFGYHGTAAKDLIFEMIAVMCSLVNLSHTGYINRNWGGHIIEYCVLCIMRFRHTYDVIRCIDAKSIKEKHKIN